ncbi:hypothetical protein Droror1_Dr00026360 [Drosera rotundifolia]
MASSDDEVLYEFRFFRVLKSGEIQFSRPPPTATVPPVSDPTAAVLSKDVTISDLITARIFIPRSATTTTTKLPLLLYFHGGGFSIESPFSPNYHAYVESLVADATVVAVSVHYGLFPSRPIPACYEDAVAALNWAVGDHKDPWLAHHVDFNRIFVGGDSAGGNISYTVLSHVGRGSHHAGTYRIVGGIFVHPYFGGTGDDQMWLYMSKGNNEGLDDPRLKPTDEDLKQLGCERAIVFVAEKDHLMKVGIEYVERLRGSGWNGNVELVVNEGREHCFHLFSPEDPVAVENQRRIVEFINRG